MTYTITSIIRFARRWSLQGWVIPAVCAAVLATLAFGLLSRAVPTVESQRTSDFGGRSMLIATNGSLDPSAGPDRLLTAIAQLEAAGAVDVCGYVSSFIQAPDALDGVLTYREQQTQCHEQEWGYELLEGTWPNLPGEVAATEATGLRVGDRIEGSVPGDLVVVAVATSAFEREATSLLAAGGTWESWDLGSVGQKYPGVSGSVQIALNGNSTQLAEAATSLFGSEAVIAQADTPPPSLVGSFPFLYQWPATVLAALGGGLALAVHARTSSHRIRLLEDQGIRYRRAATIVRFAELVSLGAAISSGVAVGWLLTELSGPLVESISNSVAAPTPIPFDPMVRLIVVTFIGWGLFAVAPSLVRASARFERSSDVLRRQNALPTVRWCAAVVSVIGAGAVFVNGQRADGAFGAIALVVLAAGLTAPEGLLLIARWGERTSSVPRRLAFRRLANRPAAAAVAFTAAAVLVGPVVAMLILMSSTLTDSDQSATIPPSEGQAIYSLSGADRVDEEIESIMRTTLGTDSPIVIRTPQTADGRGVVATADSLGALLVVDDVGAAESALGIELLPESAAALQTGGVLWAGGGTGTQLWILNEDGGAPTAVSVPAVASQEWDERWQNEYRGVLLTSSIEKLDLTTVPTQFMWVGIDPAQAASIDARLRETGFASDIVETYDGEFSYGFSDLSIGMIALLIVVGVLMLAGSTWSMATALRTQAAVFTTLGAPRSWLARVLIVESGVPILVGTLAGGFIGLAGTVGALSAINATITVPWPAIAAAVAGAVVLTAACLAVNLARTRFAAW